MDRRPFLVFCGVLLLPVAWCTTVAPLCKSGEMGENCTTASVQKKSTRHGTGIQIVDCDEDKKNFCFNGKCQYIVDLEKMSCRCQNGYSGERCMFMDYVHSPMSKEYVVLTAILSVLFVITLAVGSYFIYKWYKNKLCKEQQQPPTKDYKEVATCSV